MQKKAAFVVLGTVLMVIIVAVTLVLTVGPRTSAVTPEDYDDVKVTMGTVNQTGYLAVDTASGTLHGLSDAGKNYVAQFDAYRVIVPDNVKVIDNDAFAQDTRLKAVVLSHSVTRIMHGAFQGCTQLTAVNIPASVNFLGSYVFADCVNLASMKVNPANTVFTSQSSAGVEINGIIKRAEHSLVAGCQNTVIAADVTSIGTYAFKGQSNLTTIDIPDSVTTVEQNAFAQCSGLKTVNGMTNVATISSSAFVDCTNLSTIVFGNKLTSIGCAAFKNCTQLTKIVVPDNVTTIKGYAFANTSLKRVTITDGVQTIEQGAFANCKNLKQIKIPASVTVMGAGVFAGGDLKELDFVGTALPDTWDTNWQQDCNANVVFVNE